jgi:hypothetical protein
LDKLSFFLENFLSLLGLEKKSEGLKGWQKFLHTA